MNIKKRSIKWIGVGISIVLILILGLVLAVNHYYKAMTVEENPVEFKEIPKYDRNENNTQQEMNQNIAIFGVDKEAIRTDVIFVVNVNTMTNEIKVISVPRDTKVAWTTFQQEKMEELGKGYHEYSKITEMSAYGGLDNLRYFTVNTLEDIMGISIDHYIIVNIDAFRKVVDAIGGVEVDVPRRMQYTDNYQNLSIDLYPGMQLLNGAQAEGLVRWRHNKSYTEQYPMGDIGRIETQQLFLKALAKKILSTNTIDQLFKIINIAYEDLKTDIAFNELKDYVKSASQFDVDHIDFATLPGEAVTEDRSYYKLTQGEVDAFMQKFLYNIDVPIIEEETENTAFKLKETQDNTQPKKKVEVIKEIEDDEPIIIQPYKKDEIKEPTPPNIEEEETKDIENSEGTSDSPNKVDEQVGEKLDETVEEGEDEKIDVGADEKVDEETPEKEGNEENVEQMPPSEIIVEEDPIVNQEIPDNQKEQSEGKEDTPKETPNNTPKQDESKQHTTPNLNEDQVNKDEMEIPVH